MHPSTTARRHGPVLAAAALAGLLLAGCGDPGPPGGTPATPAATASPRVSTSPTAAEPTAPDGAWGAYPDRAEACAAVTEDLVALALLPANLSAAPTVERVQSVEDEVETVRDSAPPELTAHFARVQLLVDSYGEELAEDPDARFDGRTLDEALAPVRDWLDENCRDAA